MGRLKNGLFGNVTGRIGNLVAYTLNGQNVVRQIGVINVPPSDKQKANYQKMSLVNAFLKPIQQFIKAGFGFAVAGTDKQPYNEAVSYNKKNAIIGEYPHQQIDYRKALISIGDLPAAVNPTIQLITEGVKFTWENQDSPALTIKDDRTMLLLYFPENDTGISILSGARRLECIDFIPLSPDQFTMQIECYIAFYADDRLSVSNSIWVGRLN